MSINTNNVTDTLTPTAGTLTISGAATATSVNKVAITAPATSATLTLADGSTLATSGAFPTTITSTGTTAVTLPTSGTLATIAGTETFTNKRITPRIVSITNSATVTPTGDTADQYEVTALAVTAAIAAPSGTPTDGQRLILRIKDNGTRQTLSWTTTSGAYRSVGITLPTTTVPTIMYVGCVYNSADAFWDVVAVAQV